MPYPVASTRDRPSYGTGWFPVGVIADMKLDIQTFSVAGTFTWTKPAGAQLVDLYMMPGGQGGDNGGAFGANYGGGGLGATTAIAVQLLAADLGATETVIVGAGGVGRIAAIAPVGSAVPGGYSQFGDIIVADPADLVYSSRSGNYDFTGGTWIIRPNDGGAGGANTASGSNGNPSSIPLDVSFGTGGLTDTDGVNGESSVYSAFNLPGTGSIPYQFQNGGGGGGGGGGETSVKPGKGGNGGWPGGGGGGGGEAASGGSANGGAGGNGGAGVVVVTTWCN